MHNKCNRCIFSLYLNLGIKITGTGGVIEECGPSHWDSRQKESSGTRCYCSCERLRLHLKIPVVCGGPLGWGKRQWGEGTILYQNASQFQLANNQRKEILDLRGVQWQTFLNVSGALLTILDFLLTYQFVHAGIKKFLSSASVDSSLS